MRFITQLQLADTGSRLGVELSGSTSCPGSVYTNMVTFHTAFASSRRKFTKERPCEPLVAFYRALKRKTVTKSENQDII